MKLTLLMTTVNFLMIMMAISQKIVSMGAILLTSASVLSLTIAYLVNSWYAFILFLIYVTGLLVLFGYFLAMSPNSYQTAKKCFKAYFLILIPMAIPMTNYFNVPTFKVNIEKDIISLVAYNNMPIYILMVIILLLMLLMVVSLTYKAPTPLRKYMA